MPSFTIHLAVAKRYLENHRYENEEEFLNGVIAPDLMEKPNSHYGEATSKPGLDDFILENKLDSSYNRGYLLHLYTDKIFYQQFLDMRGFKKDIYNDYDILNKSIVEKYKIDIPSQIKDIVSFKEGVTKLLVENEVFEFIEKVSQVDFTKKENWDVLIWDRTKYKKILTERLLLRPLGKTDFNDCCEYFMDRENTKYMMFFPFDNKEEIKEFLGNVEEEWRNPAPTYYEWAIIYQEKMVGAIGLYFETDDGVCELGWHLNKAYWNLGIMYESAVKIIDYCVTSLNCNEFVAHCDSENVASYALMEKLGMKFKEKCSGRKNRCSDEEREELTYTLVVM